MIISCSLRLPQDLTVNLYIHFFDKEMNRSRFFSMKSLVQASVSSMPFVCEEGTMSKTALERLTTVKRSPFWARSAIWVAFCLSSFSPMIVIILLSIR